MITYSKEAKYLGITLNQRLTFSSHIRKKVNAAKGLLYKFKNAVGQLWGPSPSHMRWVYTGIIRPKITYGAIVWANKARNHQRSLDRLQRLGMLAMTHMRRTTPTRGVEAIIGLMPLDLYIESMATRTTLRVMERNRPNWDGIGRGRLRGHLHQTLNTLKELELYPCQQDIGGTWFWNKKVQVQEETLLPPDSIRCYVRGCKQNDKIGWGCHILDKSITYNIHGSLGREATNFQAEIHAISQAARSLGLKKGEDIYILASCRSTLQALKRQEAKTLTIQECINTLECLAIKNRVTVTLDTSHEGHSLGTTAGDQAKLATNKDPHTPPPIPKAITKGLINGFYEGLWGRRWRETPSCRQTKLWVLTPGAVGRLVTKLDQGKLGKIIQALTGHNYLNYHRSVLQESLTDKCRFCGEAREEFVHLVRECTALTKERAMLHKYGNICDPQGFRSLLRFILMDHIEEAMSPTG